MNQTALGRFKLLNKCPEAIWSGMISNGDDDYGEVMMMTNDDDRNVGR